MNIIYHAFSTFVFASILCLGAGCVAFNVGKPTVIIDEQKITEKSATPVNVEVVAAKPQYRQASTDRVSVGLCADIEETYEKRIHSETSTIRKQRRLAIGFFPGAAEIYSMPEGALSPVLFASQNSQGEYNSNPQNLGKDYISSHLVFGVLSCGIAWVAPTVYSLLGAPFDSWECSHDYVDTAYVEKSLRHTGWWTASYSPKLGVLHRHSDELGIHTCLDVTRKESNPSHVGLIGSHKYVAVFVDGPTIGPSTVIGRETKRDGKNVNGPYIVEFSIPELRHFDWKRVTSSESLTSFPLPIAPYNCRADAVVTFREDDSQRAGIADDLTRKTLAKAKGQSFRFEVNLQGSGDGSGRVSKSYEIVGITPSGDGKYSVQVKILDKSKTFSIGRNLENEVKRLIREDYFGKHPETPMQHIRETVEWETEDGGNILVYTGWAFSVRPVDDGWSYDSHTRRGWVRLRITGGMPAEDAKRWARDNIAAIVSEKNVEIEAGKVPPPGAAFRSLGESFENGILTVEFEAVQ